MAPTIRPPPRSIRRASRIPPIKLYEAGKLRDDLLDLLALNIRNPRDFRGDLAAMLGAAHLGERRLSQAVHRVRCAGGGGRGRGDPRCQPSSRPAPWSRPGRTASSTARRFSMTTATAATDIRIAAKVTKKRQRHRGRSLRLRSAVDQLRQLLARQHAGRGGDGLCLSDRPRHRRRTPARCGR